MNESVMPRESLTPAIGTGIAYGRPFEAVLEAIAGAGFGICALSSRIYYSRYVDRRGRASLSSVLRTLGLQLDNIHAPYRNSLISASNETCDTAVAECRIAIDAASELGARAVVVHLAGSSDGQELQSHMRDQALRSVDALVEYGQQGGVQIALENTTPLSHRLLPVVLDARADAILGMCYDAGHAAVAKDGVALLQTHGARLITVHLHDNDGERDEHLLPGEGILDLQGIVRIITSLDYSGPLLLESVTDNSLYKEPADFLAEAYRRACALVD